MIVHNPKSIMTPNGTYSHGAEVPPNARWLFIAGQVSGKLGGDIPKTFDEQADVVWKNVLAILADADMSVNNLVKIQSFITRTEDFQKFFEKRAQYLGAHRPASTLIVVAALADPAFLVEIEGVAAA